MTSQLTFEGRLVDELSREELIRALEVLYRLYQRNIETAVNERKTWMAFVEARGNR